LKTFHKIAAAIFIAAVLFSCNKKKSIQVKFIGEVDTRRTFADIQFMDNEKERDKYIVEQKKSNPMLMNTGSAADSILIQQFKRLGLVKDDEFLQTMFKPETKPQINFIDNANQNFPVKFYNDSLSGTVHFKIFFSKDSIDIDTKATPLQDLDYTFLDVIPGGNKELVFLDDYYIMNGYNFDLKVYEIRTQ